MILTPAGFSETGPRKDNEDSILLDLNSVRGVFAVADGLGGHGGGSLASSLAINTVKELSDQDFKSALVESHLRIKKQQIATDFQEMATTLTAVHIQDYHLVGIHTGDTRCAIQRAGGIKKLTQAHTEAQRLLDAGKITKSEFLTYPRRNIVDSALGMNGDFKSQFFDFTLEPGDKIILTTDGVHEKLLLREMMHVIDQLPALEAADAVKRRIDVLGPEDNFSLIIVDVE